MNTVIEHAQSLNYKNIIFTLATTGTIITTWYLLREYRKCDDDGESIENNVIEIITRDIGTQTDTNTPGATSHITGERSDFEEYHSPDNNELLSDSPETDAFAALNDHTSEISELVGYSDEGEVYQQSESIWLNLAQMRKMEERLREVLLRREVERAYPDSMEHIETHSDVLIDMATALRILTETFADCPPLLLITTLEDFIKGINQMS